MLPNLIVIGAMKCATTSLHYYLDAHPRVAMSHPKELHFFTGPSAEREPGLATKLNLPHSWHLGRDWYESQFTGEPNRILIMAQEDLYARRRETLQRLRALTGESFADWSF